MKFIATGEQTVSRLDHALAAWLPEALARPVSKAKVRKLIMAGAVYLNGRPVRIASKALTPGAKVEAYIDLGKLFEDSTSRDRTFELSPDRILFEDADLIAIDKPPGIPAQPTLDAARDNLFSAVSRFLSKRDGLAKPYLGVHHRLDRDTSGVVLFTKSQRVNAAIADVFSERHMVKIYQAITVPRPDSWKRKLEKKWTIRNRLGKVSSRAKRATYGAVQDGDVAETSFRLLAEYARGIWLEAIPATGRTHQIRVHLSEYGLPILGDDLYGTDQGLAARQMLHASELIFPHPMTGLEISVKSALPGDFVRCLKEIESR